MGLMNNSSFAKGVFFAASAYFVWGVLPMYWRLLSLISPMHILAYRIVFSLLSVGLVLILNKNFSWLKFYQDRKTRFSMLFAGLLICYNWGLYIWAVNEGRTIETSLGYYINPLISIGLGLCFFKEKLKLLQIIAVASAFVGVMILTIFTGRLPWISLSLAVSFAFYSILKKTVKLSALESLGAETLVAAPVGLLLLLSNFGTAQSFQFTGLQGLSYMMELPNIILFALIFCGAATSFPLYLFAKGAKMLPLSTLGFIQFISPTMSFLIGLFVFRESFPVRNFIAFGFIWAAAILYIVSLKSATKSR